MWSNDLWQRFQDHSMGKEQSLQQMVPGKLDLLMWKILDKDGPVPYAKMNSTYIKNLNLRPKLKFLEENIRGKLHDTEFGNEFLDMRPKTQATKANRQMGVHQT